MDLTFTVSSLTARPPTLRRRRTMWRVTASPNHTSARSSLGTRVLQRERVGDGARATREKPRPRVAPAPANASLEPDSTSLWSDANRALHPQVATELALEGLGAPGRIRAGVARTEFNGHHMPGFDLNFLNLFCFNRDACGLHFDIFCSLQDGRREFVIDRPPIRNPQPAEQP